MSTVKGIDNQYFIKIGIVPDGKKKEDSIVIGTRPNFIKITQFEKEAKKFPNLEIKVVHTGQHYDTKMADVFFEQFNLVPDYFLNIAPSTANKQMAESISKLEDELIDHKPDWVIVVGDVNSTFAAALTANKLDIKIAHLESGLRSFDKSMPEEHNRILTDAISDLFFVTAAGLISLEKMSTRLGQDHARAKSLFEGLKQVKGLKLDASPSSNMVYFDLLDEVKLSVNQIVDELKKRGVLVDWAGPRRLPLVTHYWVDDTGGWQIL